MNGSPCSVSTEQSDHHAESLWGLSRLNRVAKMESHQLGQSHVLRRFLPADLSSESESRIQRRIRRSRSARCRVVSQGRVRAVLINGSSALPVPHSVNSLWMNCYN